MTALLAGEVDVTSAVGQERVGPAAPRRRRGPRLADRAQHRLPVPQQRSAPFGDARVRQAIARPSTARPWSADAGRPRRAGAQPAPPPVGLRRRTQRADPRPPAARRLLSDAGPAAASRPRCSRSDTPRPYLPAPLRAGRRPLRPTPAIGVRARLRSCRVVGLPRPGHPRRLRPGGAGLAGGHPGPERFPVRAARIRVRGNHQPQPLPQRGHGRVPEAGPRGSDQGERMVSLPVEAQTLFQRDMPWVPLFHVSVFTAFTAASSAAWWWGPPAPEVRPRMEKAYERGPLARSRAARGVPPWPPRGGPKEAVLWRSARRGSSRRPRPGRRAGRGDEGPEDGANLEVRPDEVFPGPR